MDTLPLPPRPDLGQYKKRAKGLVTAAAAGDAAVREWTANWLESLRTALGVEPSAFVRDSIDRAVTHIEKRVAKTRSLSPDAKSVTLADAQYLIAEAHGFENWGAFSRHVERMSGKGAAETDDFERAADAIVAGDLETLSALIAEKPALIHARSSRVHRVTLLHYIAANGVEDFRQKTPKNAVEIARFLLEHGAEPDAVAETYGGGAHQTTMNLLVSSTHPADAGLMSPLVEVLVDFGAAVNGVADDESPVLTALYFGYKEAAETLAKRGARLDTPMAAAALGRLDLIRQMILGPRTVRSDVPLIDAPWFKQDALDMAGHVGRALAWACKFGRGEVASFLIDLGVDPSSHDNDDMTALHWAAATGMTTIVDELLRRGAPLEVENTWGGTVLNSTLHFALYMPIAGVDYPAMVDQLLAAGADANVVEYPTGNARIDALLGPRRTS